MRMKSRVILTTLTVILLVVQFTGCKQNAEKHQNGLTGYNSFRDIPGVTEEEIEGIEALKGQISSFVFGMNPSTEAFYGEDGKLKGYSALFCEWLSKLFGIPFELSLYEWGDLLAGLKTGEIDFTGEMTATDERRKTYYMTDSIAERSVKIMRLAGSSQPAEIASWRPLRYAFLDGATTVHDVTALVHEPFESLLVSDYDDAYDLLKTGKADAFIDEGPAEAAFDVYGDIIAEDFFPMIYSPVSMSTQKPALQPVISVLNKALKHDGLHYLTELYNKGHHDYIQHKLYFQLTDEERAYIQNNPVVSFVAEYDNYPVCFYNTRENEWQGITFDVLSEVNVLTGLQFKIQNGNSTSWPDLIRMLENGEASMISELIRSQDREGRFLWPKNPVMTDFYALLSKLDYRNININEILYTKIGLTRDTAYAAMFHAWFPDHRSAVEYENSTLAFSALDRGEIDMVMASRNQLLILTNYRELPGYKANVVFDRPFNSTFGFNKNEAILCSIIDKTLSLVDTRGISEQWTRRTYDYREKLVSSRLPWFAGVASLLLCILILLLILFRINRNEGKHLENLVQKRTAEIEKQNKLMYIVNNAAALLQDADIEDHFGAMRQGMEIIGRSVDVDRVSVWQNHLKEDGRLYYKVVCQWANDGLPDLDVDSYFAYKDIVPSWEGIFSRGDCVNGLVEDLGEPERSVLGEFKMLSLLAIPIFLKGKFWGFVSFDDYHNRRGFPEGELYVLRSWGLLIVSAIQRQDIALNMQRTLKKLEAVNNNYKGIIWSVDRDGIITSFNGQYLKKIGVEPTFLEGKNIELARLKNRHLDIIDRIKKTYTDGPQDWTGEIDGGMFHSSTTLMYDTEGNAVGVVGSTDDVTDIIKLQRDLENALEDAQAASRAKSVFLANMSHEIRTPMNAIIGMTNIGKSAADSEKKDHCFSKIDDASKHLLGVINDILDMSKIEANKFELSPVDFNFEKMLQRVVNVINFRVDEKKQRFMVHIDHSIPRNLIGDDQRLAQVITNLIGNAVKFTPEFGAIDLNAHLAGEEDGLCTIQVSVTDSGIGISPEQQARLFQSFQQAETSTSRKFGGTGLGLSISKNIVEMMGGRIWVESEFGKGSSFVFTVKAKRGVEKKPESADKVVNWSTIRVLAVDDDPDVLEFLGETLKMFGASCDTAKSGEEALTLVEQKGSYGICFVDWKLPGMDGMSLTRLLKAKAPAPDDISVIMITAADWSALEKDAKDAGVDKFLPKPLFPSSIADTINGILGVDYKQMEEEKPDLEKLFAGHRIMLAEDVEINREIVLTLLEPTRLEIDCAENGLEAVRKFMKAPDKYEMIFMDVQMPEMDGYEATQTIRALDIPNAKTIPIIAMTANVFREDVERCLEAGMNSHVGKPLDLDEVIEKLGAFLPKL